MSRSTLSHRFAPAAAVCLILLARIGFCADGAKWSQILPTDSIVLRDPRSISVSAEGLLYVADTGHHRVIAVNDSGRLIAETGGFGTGHGQFRWPRFVAANQGNAVWILDYGNRRIEKFSRNLEYQGTVEIQSDDEGGLSQPEAMAVSPSGDVYVFERNNGRIMRYDPLFRLQAEVGSRAGSDFIPSITSLEFIRNRGLVWWDGEREILKCTDPLLNATAPIRLRCASETPILAAIDTCLAYYCGRTIASTCLNSAQPDTLLPGDMLDAAKISSIRAMAGGRDGDLYLLDNSARIFRFRLARE